MRTVAENARECLNCGNICTSDICEICASEKRATGELCVVEDVADLWAMERAAVFKGRYHVLGGTLSALDAQGVPVGGELDYLDDGTITAALRARKSL